MWDFNHTRASEMIAKLGNIEENCEEQNEDENKEELKESNSWAEKHIEEYNKPKFNWNEFLASRK